MCTQITKTKSAGSPQRVGLRRNGTIAAALALLLLTAAPAVLAEEGDFQRPKYQFQRQNEDWSGLAGQDLTQTGDLFDPLKYVPLSDDGSIWVSFGGHARLRVENWNDFGFAAAPKTDDTFLLTRLALHADVHVGDNVRLFAEGTSALSTDRDLPGGQRTLDVDTGALQQAFVDVTLPLDNGASLTLRPGRQNFLFGKQRLVSPLPWANTLRRWDGVSAILDAGGWHIHGFWSQFVPVTKYDFNDADGQTEFWGVYATGVVPTTEVGLDLYLLGLDGQDVMTYNGTTGTEDRFTAGARVWGNIADTAYDYDVEAAYQFGEVGSADISAWMFATQLGYDVPGCPASSRLHVGLDYASGDNSAGGDVETFNHLFPLGHAYLGYIDTVGRQNIIDASAGITATPLADTTVGVTGHFFWRADDSDALYNAGGGVARAAAPGTDSEVGAEVDLTVKHAFDRHLQGLLGYSHFFAGDFIKQTGTSKDIDFVYAQLQYTF